VALDPDEVTSRGCTAGHARRARARERIEDRRPGLEFHMFDAPLHQPDRLLSRMRFLAILLTRSLIQHPFPETTEDIPLDPRDATPGEFAIHEGIGGSDPNRLVPRQPGPSTRQNGGIMIRPPEQAGEGEPGPGIERAIVAAHQRSDFLPLRETIPSTPVSVGDPIGRIGHHGIDPAQRGQDLQAIAETQINRGHRQPLRPAGR
jgi:hypothetical protein